jgi:hypothetical protein
MDLEDMAYAGSPEYSSVDFGDAEQGPLSLEGLTLTCVYTENDTRYLYENENGDLFMEEKTETSHTLVKLERGSDLDIEIRKNGATAILDAINLYKESPLPSFGSNAQSLFRTETRGRSFRTMVNPDPEGPIYLYEKDKDTIWQLGPSMDLLEVSDIISVYIRQQNDALISDS